MEELCQMLIEVDNFLPPGRKDLEESIRRWANETEAEYIQRIQDIFEIKAFDFKAQNARREARRPFYPLFDDIEVHIAQQLQFTRKLISVVGGIIIFMLALIAIALFRLQVS